MLVCIETASKVAQALEIKKVLLNYRYCEWQAHWLFKRNPMPYLEVNQREPAILDEEYDLC